MSFFGLLCRSDAAALTTPNISYTPHKGYCLAHISKSKTDQLGEGYTLPIILHCRLWTWEPDFLAYWQERVANTGAWFPTYDAHRKLVDDSKPLSREAVGRVLTNWLREA